MKKYFFLVLIMLFNYFLFCEDPYDRLVNELAKNAEGVSKITVIPFSYADNISSTKDGSVIAERLTMRLVNLKKFEVIERSSLDKVLQELKLQNSGIIDENSAKQLGKILGVDAIITGTLVLRTNGKIEVNARIIKTDTAHTIGAAQAIVLKDWMSISQFKTKIIKKEKSPYDEIVREIVEISTSIKKIAIIPFSYATNTSTTSKDGTVIAERLTIELINLKKFEVIERNLLDKVLVELKLQNSGTIDINSVKQFGKILGVDAIVTGTLVSIGDGKIEVNTRVIETDTAKIITTVQSVVTKDWIGDNPRLERYKMLKK